MAITYHNTKPAYPVQGDVYFDTITENSYVFANGKWALMASSPLPKKSMEPTEDELKKYPALKTVWEDYLVVRNLVGL